MYLVISVVCIVNSFLYYNYYFSFFFIVRYSSRYSRSPNVKEGGNQQVWQSLTLRIRNTYVRDISEHIVRLLWRGGRFGVLHFAAVVAAVLGPRSKKPRGGEEWGAP